VIQRGHHFIDRFLRAGDFARPGHGIAALQMADGPLQALNRDLIEHFDQLGRLGRENPALQILALRLLDWIGALHDMHIANGRGVSSLFQARNFLT